MVVEQEIRSKNRLVLVAIATAAVAVLSFRYWRNSQRNFFRVLSKTCKEKILKKTFYVSVTSSASDWDQLSAPFLKSITVSRVVGLDCEWVSKDNSPVALLQLSSHLGHCQLVRLCKIHKVPDSLSKLLGDETILKLGVATLDDSKRLKRDYGIIVRGCLDIRHVARGHPDQYKLLTNIGLAGLAQKLLGITLDKNFRIKCSQWDSPKLTPAQIQYAALDAFVSVPIFCELVHSTYVKIVGNRLQPLSAAEKWGIAHDIVSPFVDVGYKYKTPGSGDQSGLSSKEVLIVATKKTTVRVTALKETKRGFTPRNGPLYSNCFMEAPDGEVLCTCDSKKALWYLSKGIAVKVKDEPLTVRLKFEPSGRPIGECDQYYQTPKENCCVVCGKADSYVRKNIVPQEYRKHFPDVMKNHQSHDVLLLCTVCHRVSNSHDLTLRIQLAEECQAPLGTEENVKVKEDFGLRKVVSAARALTSAQKSKIPASRLDELKQAVCEFYSVETVTEEILKKAMRLESRTLNEAYIPHGVKVVTEFIEKKGGLVLLERRWREHFLETMRPKYLPALWSIDHNKERLDNRIVQNRVNIVDYRKAVRGLHENNASPL